MTLLTSEFGVCEGDWTMNRTQPPEVSNEPTALQIPEVPEPVFELEKGSLLDENGDLIEKDVVDYRESADGTMIVLEKQLGTRDRIHQTWTGKKSRGKKTRETRFFIAGMDHKAVISRLPQIHSVQFIEAGEGADAATVLVSKHFH